MTKEAETPSDGVADEGGKSVDPKALPRKPERPVGTDRAVPIGRPMSDEEFRKAKEKAKLEKPPGQTTGQQDPSAAGQQES